MSRCCNRALLVSVSDFYPGVCLTRRSGARRDTQRLHAVLTHLGFQVSIHNDLTAEEIQQVFKAASEQTVDTCFLALMSSHGEEGLVFGADGEAVPLRDIFSYFNSTAMEGKTKLFFVQACRGDSLDAGVTLETDSAEQDGQSFCPYLSIPEETAVTFATVPGYAAFMHPLGSVFIQTLCDLLESEEGCDWEVTRLLTRLNHRVAFDFQARGGKLAGKKAMPCFITRLTRPAFPFSSKRREATSGTETGKKLRKRSVS